MSRRRPLRRCRDNRIRFGRHFGFRSVGFNSLQHSQPRLSVALPAEQPAWTFRKPEAEGSVEQRRKHGHTQHPAPGIRADAGEQRVRDESDQDAKNNIELKHSRKPSAILGRRNLRNVHRRDHGRDADAQSADDPRDDENNNVRRESRTHRTHKVKNADPEQRGFASKSISRPAPEQRTNHGAVKGRSHGNAVQSGAQSPKRLNSFFGSRNNHRVETEKKSGERRRKRPEDDATIHRETGKTEIPPPLAFARGSE